MNYPFYIARRYLFAKKSSSMISAISVISLLGVAVASAALVVVLSVFNGFQDLVATFFTTFDPQLKVVPAEGKTLAADNPALLRLQQLPQVETVTACFEERALLVYGDNQTIVVLKGMDDNFASKPSFRSILVGNDDVALHAADLEFAVPGILLAHQIGLTLRDDVFLHIYAPQKEGQLDMANPADGFVVDSLYAAGAVFQVNQPKYDANYVVVPIAFVRRLFDGQGLLTSLELQLKSGSNLRAVKAEMSKIGGESMRVLDRYEQQSETFNIMNIEKLLAFLFLTFILVVACFNIIGTLSMLMIDKKDDVQTLRSLGAKEQQIGRIFFYQGVLVTLVGALLGIGVGLLACWLQQQYGFVRLGPADGTYVVDAYPVSVHYIDVLIVFATVMAVGCLAVWYPVRHFSRRLLQGSDNSQEK